MSNIQGFQPTGAVAASAAAALMASAVALAAGGNQADNTGAKMAVAALMAGTIGGVVPLLGKTLVASETPPAERPVSHREAVFKGIYSGIGVSTVMAGLGSQAASMVAFGVAAVAVAIFTPFANEH